MNTLVFAPPYEHIEINCIIIINYDISWQIMTEYGILCQIITDYNRLWQLMADPDWLWQIMTDYDRLWQIISCSPSYAYDRITSVANSSRSRAPRCQASRALALFVARQQKSVASIRAIRAISRQHR